MNVRELKEILANYDDNFYINYIDDEGMEYRISPLAFTVNDKIKNVYMNIPTADKEEVIQNLKDEKRFLEDIYFQLNKLISIGFNDNLKLNKEGLNHLAMILSNIKEQNHLVREKLGCLDKTEDNQEEQTDE